MHQARLSFLMMVCLVIIAGLIAGGYFLRAGRSSAKYIAAWDGSSWKSLDSKMDGGVWALASYDNKVIAGGEFTTAGGVAARGIAAWTPQ